MTTVGDHCIDCGRLLPIVRPLYHAANGRARCETCEIKNQDVQDAQQKKERTE